jgi:hypothetical protein
MTALDELFEEMQSIWTADGKRKQLLIQRSQLEQALLSTAVRQLKPGPILRHGENYWFSLEDLLVFLLVFESDQEATPKHRRIAALISRAIEELGRPPAANPKP